MKNLYKIFGIFFITLFLSNNAFSYWLDFENKWFYSNLSKNIDEIDSQLYSIEIQKDWGNAEKINSYLWKECLKKNLTKEEIKNISEKQDISDLFANINSECKDENWNFPLNLTNQIISSIQNLDKEITKNSESKTKKALWFSNIWIYSDWNDKNSPFDLKKDLENIEKILFLESFITEYDADETIDLWEKVKNHLNQVKKNNSKNNENQNELEKVEHSNLCDLSGNCDNYTELQKLICKQNGDCDPNQNSGFLSIHNEFKCEIDSSELNSMNWKILIKTLNQKQENNENKNSQNKENLQNENKKNSIKKQIPKIEWNYKKVNDNKVFPCNNFFCINIDFKTYNHNLIWTYNSSPSIEYLINRSNQHLKKFVNSSLSQSKMTINNFELSLKDINLPEMFHLWIQLSYEPVPILSLDKDFTTWKDKESNQDNWELKLNSQLEKYYKAYWLDYNLRNDLSAINQIELTRQAILNSNWSFITAPSNKLDQLQDINKDKMKELNSFQNTLEEKVRFENDSDLELKMKEIESYNKILNNYALNLEAILKEMLKIPVDSSKS